MSSGSSSLGRGFAWRDTGTHESLLEASTFIETIEKRQGLKVASIEEVAYRMGYIDAEQVRALAEPFKKDYLRSSIRSLPSVRDWMVFSSWTAAHLLLFALFLVRANWQLSRHFRRLAAGPGGRPGFWTKWAQLVSGPIRSPVGRALSGCDRSVTS